MRPPAPPLTPAYLPAMSTNQEGGLRQRPAAAAASSGINVAPPPLRGRPSPAQLRPSGVPPFTFKRLFTNVALAALLWAIMRWILTKGGQT